MLARVNSSDTPRPYYANLREWTGTPYQSQLWNRKGTPLTLPFPHSTCISHSAFGIFRHWRPDPQSALVMHDLSNPGRRKKRLFFSLQYPHLLIFFLVSEGKEYRYRYGASGSHRGYSWGKRRGSHVWSDSSNTLWVCKSSLRRVWLPNRCRGWKGKHGSKECS